MRRLQLVVTLSIATCALVFAPGAGAAVFTVNSTGDGADFNPFDSVCETAAGNGVCTFRAAVDQASSEGGDVHFRAGSRRSRSDRR